MRAAVAEISSKSVAESSVTLSTKNAWARYVRRRWPNNGVKGAMAEWDLTEGEAKGLVYAQASQPTIDKILDHPRGGFGLGLEILAIKTGTSLENYIENEARRAAREARSWAEREAQLEALATRVAERGRVDRREA